MEISTIPVDQLNYEQAYSELEKIVVALEGSQTSLEEAIALYQRGQALSKHCEDLLEKAELQIRYVEGEEDLDSEEETE